MMTNEETCSAGNGEASVSGITGHPKASDFPGSPSLTGLAAPADGRAPPSLFPAICWPTKDFSTFVLRLDTIVY